MRGFVRKSMVFVLMLSMFLSGCGTPIIPLTEEEEDIIVAYASGAVAKGNLCQTQGLTYLQPEPEEEQEVLQEQEQEQPIEDENQTDNTENVGQTETENTNEVTTNVTTFTELLNMAGIIAEYKGYEISDTYTEGGYFAINAAEGNTFVILKVALTNSTEQPIDCNIYEKNLSCGLLVNGALSARAMTTIMLNDFLTYINTIEPMATADTVVIFEVSEEVIGDVQTLAIELEMNETLYHIELE